MEITVINRQTKVDWDPGLEIKVIQALQRTGQIHGLPPETEVSLVLVDEEEIRSFNREYRGVDRPTDVLSFALNEGTSDEPGYEAPEEMEPVLGDIIISLETAETKEEITGTAWLGKWRIWRFTGCCTCWGTITRMRKRGPR